jgi:nucleotide-binding universal stress UspA family protein
MAYPEAMAALRSILCSVDFSDQSQQALRWALALASRHESRITVITAVEPLLASAAKMRLGTDLARTETVPALQEFVAAVVPKGTAWASPPALLVKVGDAPEVILESAASGHADLIVMGTQGLGGFRKLLLGSTTERVLRLTRVPVLAVPMGAAECVALGPEGGRLDLRGILAPTDFSPTSLAALDWAAMLAQENSVPLVMAHVVAPLAVAPQWRPYVEEADEQRVREARARLAQLSTRLPATQARELVVSLGRPADAIAAIADERDAGLIVMGLTGTEDASRRPGSIAYRVLALSRVPVLVVPAAG